MAVLVKETPGGTPVRVTRLISGERVQGVEAAAPQRLYFSGFQAIDLSTTPTPAKTLTIPVGARFATGRLIGTVDTDFARFLFADTPTASAGEPLYHKEEIDISSPTQFKIIVGSAAGAISFIVQYWDYAL